MKDQDFTVRFNGTKYHCFVTKNGSTGVLHHEGEHYIDQAFDDSERRRLEHGLDLAIERAVKRIKKRGTRVAKA